MRWSPAVAAAAAVAASVAGFAAGRAWGPRRRRRRRDDEEAAEAEGTGGGGEEASRQHQQQQRRGTVTTLATAAGTQPGRRRLRNLCGELEDEFGDARTPEALRRKLAEAGLDEGRVASMVELFFPGGRRACMEEVVLCGRGPAVFLGGACGRTSWREEEAVPALEAAGVTYYNPQVREWNHTLMVLENLMKEVAEHLLFVINGQTRGVVSIVEAAQYMAEGRSVQLLVDDVRGELAGGEAVAAPELRALNSAREYLRSVARLYDAPVYGSVREACGAYSDESGEQQQQQQQQQRTAGHEDEEGSEGAGRLLQ